MEFRNKTDKRSFAIAHVLLAFQVGISMDILVSPMRFDLKCHEGKHIQCIRGWNPIIPVSIFALGGIVGTLGLKPICRRMGLWSGILASSIFFCIGSLFVALGKHVILVSMGRLITGIASGGTLVAVPLRRPLRYTMIEMSTTSIIVLGNAFGIGIGLFNDRENVLTPLWASFFVSVIALVGLGVVTLLRGLFRVEPTPHTEGPTSNGSGNTSLRPEAEDSEETGLRDTDDGFPAEQLDVEDGEDAEVRFAQTTMKNLLTETRYRNTVVAVAALFTSQQFTGIAYFTQYLGQFFPNSNNVYADDGTTIICFFGFMVLVCNVPSLFIGASRTKVFYSLVLGASLAATTLLASGSVYSNTGLFAFGMIVLQCGFSFCGYSVPNTKAVDFGPSETSDATHTFAMLVYWSSMLIVLVVSPLLFALTPAALYAFCGLTFISIVVIIMLPFPQAAVTDESRTPR